MPPSKPQKKEPVKPKPKPTSTADVLRPVAKPIQVSAPVVAPMSYDIGQSSYIDPTVSSQWNQPLEYTQRPELPVIPTPSMPTLDLKRKAAIEAGFTDSHTKELYATPMDLQYYGSPTGGGEDGLMGYYEPSSGGVTVFRDGSMGQPVDTTLHEFAHSTQPGIMPFPLSALPTKWNEDFITSVENEAKNGSDLAQLVLEQWGGVQGLYSKDQMASELYARIAGNIPKYEEYPGRNLSSGFVNKYYSDMYKWE